jgi:hypothetical protein
VSDAPQYIEMASEVIEQYLFEPWDYITRERIEEQFRLICPGPYRFVWEEGLDQAFMPRFQLEFNDSPESTAWILRWS